MKGIKGLRLGLAGALAAALVAIGGFLVVSQVAAVTGTLSIGSATIATGGTGSVDLKSNVGAPGLGAWTVDIAYDSDVVSVSNCSPAQGGVCNPNFGPETVRITGASANGLQGDTNLGSITFRCGSSTGTSPLTLSVNVFADATIGNPTDIDETITNGSITCGAALPTLGPTGGGPSDSGFSYGWLMLALGATGLVSLAAYGALRLRARA